MEITSAMRRSLRDLDALRMAFFAASSQLLVEVPTSSTILYTLSGMIWRVLVSYKLRSERQEVKLLTFWTYPDIPFLFLCMVDWTLCSGNGEVISPEKWGHFFSSTHDFKNSAPVFIDIAHKGDVKYMFINL